MTIEPLLETEQAANNGATHLLKMTHEDLTETALATAQTIQFLTVAAKMGFRCVRFELVESFEDQSDPDNNTTAVVMGDGGSTNRFLTSTEMNRNGTEVFLKGGVNADPQLYVYTGADTVDIVVAAAAAGKALADIDKGEAHFYLEIRDNRKAA